MDPDSPTYSKPYKLYVTVLLTFIYVINQMDRAVFGFVMELIGREFQLSDTQLGLLAGPAVVIVYAVLGVPVARWADRSNRVNIMSGAVAFWSAVAAATSLVGNFWQLALMRIGIGVGEAGFAAIAQSVLGSYHATAERTRALSIFMLAIPFGGVASSLLAGWVSEAYGWRAVFVAAGLPGLLLALLLKFTVAEPPKIGRTVQGIRSGQSPFGDVARLVWRDGRLRHLCLAMTLVTVVTGTAATWLPAFFIREHGLSTSVLGSWLALTTGGGALLGAALSWWFASWRISIASQLLVMGVGAAMLTPLLLLVLVSGSPWLALAILFPAYTMKSFLLGPLWSLLQEDSPADARGTIMAVAILLQTLAAGVLAAPLVGFLSDVISAAGGEGLRWALAIVFACGLWAALHLVAASRAQAVAAKASPRGQERPE